MRKLIVSALVTLNGAVTNQRDWSLPYFDAEAKASAIEKLKECDLFLMGRVAYEQFAPVWSQIQDDSYFTAINEMPKVVLSNSIASATWNAKVLRGDAAEQVRLLKQRSGKSIMKYGVTKLDRTLIENQLVDEFNFYIYPVIAGGVRMFEGIDTGRMRLELAGTRHFASGVVQLSYRPGWLSV